MAGSPGGPGISPGSQGGDAHVKGREPPSGKRGHASPALPLCTPPLPSKETDMRDSPLRVLVVDDCKDLRDTLAMLLRAWGHEVRLAWDGPSALEAGRAFRP